MFDPGERQEEGFQCFVFDPGENHCVMISLISRTCTFKSYDHGSIILHHLDLRTNCFKGGGDDATMVEPVDYATKDKPGWMHGKFEDEPEAGMENTELILAMKNKSMEKLWIRLMDGLTFVSPKGDQILKGKDHYLLLMGQP